MSNQESLYKFNVQMGCGGCANAIRDALRNLEGLKSVDISVPEQTVSMVVEPEVLYDIVLDKIRGTGKTVRSGGVDGVAREFEMLSMAWLKSWKSMLGFFSLW